MLERALRLGVSRIECFLYYMIFFCWVSGVVRSGSARTLYLDDELWNCLLQLVKLGYAGNVSQLVNRLLADALGVVAKSDDALEDFSYDMLRKKHLKLSRELIGLERHMKDYGDDYRALVELANSLGLEIQELSNLDTVMPELISEWEGSRGTLHLFITLLEKAKEKKQIERQLERCRLEQYRRSELSEVSEHANLAERNKA